MKSSESTQAQSAGQIWNGQTTIETFLSSWGAHSHLYVSLGPPLFMDLHTTSFPTCNISLRVGLELTKRSQGKSPQAANKKTFLSRPLLWTAKQIWTLLSLPTQQAPKFLNSTFQIS